jgi:hypothetical protein
MAGSSRRVGPYLPGGARTNAIRNTIYFDGNALTQARAVLTTDLMVGAVTLTAHRRPLASAQEGAAVVAVVAAAAAAV